MITLENSVNFTAQSVFNKVAIHLLTQKVQSLDKTGDHCLYHSPEGLKCSVGCLIPEDHKYLLLETLCVIDLLGSKEHVHYKLLSRLQTLHDDTNYFTNWKDQLTDLAGEMSLNADAISHM
jgi:hypothetical protein